MATETKKLKTENFNELYGEVLGPDALRIRRLMPADMQTVWDYITQPHKSVLWLTAINTEFRQDGPYDVTFDNSRLTNEPAPEGFECSHNAGGEVLIFDPPKRFSYTWVMGENATKVLFELEPQGENTLLTLTHTELSGSALLNVAPGWHTHIGLLISLLQGKKPQPFWGTFLALKSKYQTIIRGELV